MDKFKINVFFNESEDSFQNKMNNLFLQYLKISIENLQNEENKVTI